MKKHLYALALLSALPWGGTSFAQPTDSTGIVNTLNKCWRAIGREYSTIYGLEDDEIKTFYKQKVCFTKDSIVMYSGPLYDPKYSIKKVNAETFSKDKFDCPKEKLGMSLDTVYQITISSKAVQDGTAYKMTDIIAFDGYCLYIVKDGVIFKLYDADAKPGGRSAN